MLNKKTPTRIEGLYIVHRDTKVWRYRIDGADVGPHFPTKTEAFACAEQYARDYGLTS